MIYNSDTLIPFWSEKVSPYGIYSQWYKALMTIDGIQFSCCEQYMMWRKAMLFNDVETAEKILKAESAREIRNLGREVKDFNQETWDAAKFDIVYQGNYAKFTQNADLKAQLLATGDKTLVEASPYDCIWGVGVGPGSASIYDSDCWHGTNLLGKAIMKVRDNIV